MALFGKALGNGYAITATVGRREVMEAAQSTFISSTFWTERIGSTAALKTLDVMESLKSWEVITDKGLTIKARWLDLAAKHNLPIETFGLASLAKFKFNHRSNSLFKTIITNLMLEQGFLAANSVYVSVAHTPEIIDKYFSSLDPVFGIIRDCINGDDTRKYLQSSVAHSGFTRLN